MKILRFILNTAIFTYALIFLITLATRGKGFSFELMGFELKATSPLKYLFIALGIAFIRILIGVGWKRSFLLIGSLVFSAGIAEIALRAMDIPMARTPELQRWRRPHPTMEWELVPGLKGVGSYGYEIAINSLGQRDHERPTAKPAGVYRILGIGDSFTFGVGVELKDTFLKLLEELLGEEKNFDVINAGVIAYGIDHIEAYLSERAASLQPDLVLYALYFDDIPVTVPAAEDFTESAAARKRASYEERMKEYSDPPKSRFYLGNFAKNGYSYLTSHFRFLMGADWLSSVENRHAYFLERNPDTVAIVHFAGRVEAMQKLMREEVGAEFAVVLIPDASQLRHPELQRINRVLAEEFAERGIKFADATPAFEAQSAPEKLYLFPIDAHTSPAGNAILADVIYSLLVSGGHIVTK